jgi:hypothetical protein
MGTTTAYRPPVECPLCYARFDGEPTLRSHIADDHARDELVDFVVRVLEERNLTGGPTEG